MKRFLYVIIVLGIVGFLGWQISQKVLSSKKKNFGPRRKVAVPVEITPIKNTTIRDIGSFTGTLYARSRFVVAPKISGRLEKLLVNIGDPVKPGQLIAVLDDDESTQQLEQSRAEVEVARATLEESRSNLDIVKRELERAKALRQKKIASESELDTAQAQVRAQSAKHRVAQAHVLNKEAALRAAKVRFSYTQIRTFADNDHGKMVVGERFVDEGAMLAPNAPIVSIIDINTLIAVIHVIERDYPKVIIGQQALATTDAFPDKKFVGKIIRLAPLVKETSRQARIEIEVPNQNEMLKPGMFVRVQIEFQRKDHAIVIPRGALAKRHDRQGVFLADQSSQKANFVPVSLGIVNGDIVEVLSPKLSGSVVTLGHHLLEDGSMIILPGSRSETGSTRSSPGKPPEKQSSSSSRRRP
ncbi:efflux RND transporter periplasmic adaptor subunit [Thermodesulfobacteriota bacterium]